MTYEEVLEYCGGTGYKIAKKLEVSMAAPCHWKKAGYVPIQAQIRIEELTGGELKASLDHCSGSVNAVGE